MKGKDPRRAVDQGLGEEGRVQGEVQRGCPTEGALPCLGLQTPPSFP